MKENKLSQKRGFVSGFFMTTNDQSDLSLFEIIRIEDRPIIFSIFELILVGIAFMIISCSNQVGSEKSNLMTCEVCGYKTLLKKGDECKICMTEITEEFREISEYESINELIREEQLDFFSSDFYGSGKKHLFYEPKTTTSIIDHEEYSKDKGWKPVITKENLNEYEKSMNEIGKKVKVEIEIID